jgi:hypothetical protein
VLALAVMMTGVACVDLPPVNLDATPADFEMLVGEWEGEYVSPAVGRTGTIQFKLLAGATEARGDVLMFPAASTEPYYPVPQREHGAGDLAPRFEVLTIQFVRAERGEITGLLDRYWDPDRKCPALTRFRGRLAGTVIEGTFTTSWECDFPQVAGQWKVTRKAASRKASTRR